MPKILKYILKTAVIVLIFYYLITTGKIDFLKLKLFIEKPTLTLKILLINFLGLIPIITLRWSLLLKAMKIKIPYFKAFQLTMIGNFFNTVLPGAVTGDVMKGYYLVSQYKEYGRTKGAFSLILDRILGLCGLICMALIGVLIFPDFWQEEKLQIIFQVILVIFGVISIGGIFLFIADEHFYSRLLSFLPEKLPGKKMLENLIHAVLELKGSPFTLIMTLALSILNHVLVLAIIILIGHALGVDVPDFSTHAIILTLGLMTISIPFAPSGIGVGHAAFAFYYSLAGIQGGADIFNLFVVFQFIIAALGGIFYLITKVDTLK